MMPAIAECSQRTPYQRTKDVPVRFWKRIAELRRCIEPIEDSDTGRFNASLVLDHLAWLPNSASRMDDFLKTAAWRIPEPERDRLKRAALSRELRTYGAAECGKLTGLIWKARCDQNIRTIRAIDTPPDAVLRATRMEEGAARSRQYRTLQRTLPKPVPLNKRKAEELLQRRLAAINGAVPAAGISVVELCQILRKLKNGPFVGVADSSLGKTIRRAIERDPGLFTAIKPFDGRPDLIPGMWVTREPPPIAATTTATKETNMTATSKENAPGLPTTEAEYRVHLAAKLADFTPATAAAELPHWFNSPAEKTLRSACGIPERGEFLSIANARRNELLALRDRETA